MKIRFDTYPATEEIPVIQHLRNKKLSKYFNRETAAAIVCASKLLAGEELPTNTPFFYATGLIEYEDYGLQYIAEDSVDEHEQFSEQRFIEQGFSRISPLNQFKVLQNMPLCFVSIEHHLTGENTAVYSSAASLLNHVLYAPVEYPILIGAGKVYRSGQAQASFALVAKSEIVNSPWLAFPGEAIELFRNWAPD